MARIQLASHDDLPDEEEDLLESLSPKEGLPEQYHHLIESPVRNIYRTLGRAPPVLRAFREFGRTVWSECGVSARRRELAILATARSLNAAYEWHQHVRIGLKEGLSTGAIQALGAAEWGYFDGKDRAVVEFAAGFASRSVSRPLLDAFTEQYDEETAVRLGTLVGLYSVVGLVEAGFDLETEEPFVGWDAATV